MAALPIGTAQRRPMGLIVVGLAARYLVPGLSQSAGRLFLSAQARPAAEDEAGGGGRGAALQRLRAATILGGAPGSADAYYAPAGLTVLEE